MRKLGVTVIDGPGAKVTEVRERAVLLADGRELASALTIWTAGFGVPDLAARSGLATDALGRLLTDETLTSVDNPYIVAAGDAAAPSDSPLRMSCQAAIPLGAQAANTVLSRIAGTEPAAVNQAFTGQCISLGRKAGTIQLAHLDDRVMPIYVGGRAAATVKEAVCKGTIAFLAREARKPGSYFWLKGGKRARRLAETKGATRAVAGGDSQMTGNTAGSDEHADRFTLLRPLLFTIAYEILGTATESDDVLQESYLRWAEVDLATVQDTKAYLAQLVTRQALNALRAQARRREEYVGPVATRAVARRLGRRLVGRRARRVGVDGDAGGAGNARPRRTRRVRPARGVRLQPRRNRLGHRQVQRIGAPARPPRARTRPGPPQAFRARRPEALHSSSPRSSSPLRRPETWTG